MDKLKLSNAYHLRTAFGIAYEEHNGNVELLDKTFTSPEQAADYMIETTAIDPDHSPMQIVVLRVEPLLPFHQYPL